MRMTLANPSGMRSLQPTFISWSIRKRGSVARTQKMTTARKYVLPRKTATAGTWPTSPNGHTQPPRKSSAPSAATTNVLTYSARKNIAQCAPLYSTNGPPTTSDSAK